MQLRVVLVEDDPLQAEWIAEDIIWKEFPSAEIKHFDSEFSFLAAESVIQEWQPTHALLDMLVRYYSIKDLTLRNDENSEPRGKPEEAGFRCRGRLLRVAPGCRSMIITVLDGSEDNERIQKGASGFGAKLVEFLQSKNYQR